MRPTPLPEFPDRNDIFPDRLDREIPPAVRSWDAFYDWLDGNPEGEKRRFYDRLNESEFGIISGETAADIDEQIREVETEVAFDHALVELLRARIERRHQRIEFLRSVRSEYAWDYEAELERLGIEERDDDTRLVDG